MADIFIPTLHYFENNNIFTGSCGTLRFRIAPNIVKISQKEVNLAASSIDCEFWHGEKCYELSQIEEKRTYPMSDAGHNALQAWLNSLA